MSRRSWVVLGFLVAVVFVAAVAAKGAGDKRAEWASSGHANKALAVLEATVENRGATAAHCGRCHAEQGFKAWVPQLMKGNPGLIAKPDGSAADVPYLASLGLTKFSVRPQTCTTCHNDDYSLRVAAGDTAMLPAGFQAKQVGSGALCMSCHNTRNGAVAWNSTDPRRFTAPHVAAQADVIMGKNVFFVNYGENFVSPHAAFTGDSCATCHVKFSSAGHTFKAEPKTLCASCHGPKYSADYVQRATEGLMHDLAAAISARAMAGKGRIATVDAFEEKTDTTTPNVRVNPAEITGFEPTEIHGQSSLVLKLSGGRQVASQLAGIKDASGAPVYATSDVIVRALWNYFLFHGDGSEGVHNPRFYRTVILTTIDALK